jgi:hypothetical protein
MIDKSMLRLPKRSIVTSMEDPEKLVIQTGKDKCRERPQPKKSLRLGFLPSCGRMAGEKISQKWGETVAALRSRRNG